ncbi:hypothetical protein BJ085DRAFT_38421 [Dimargaris cristalligena]|uniref:Uncharacterized protein n=1 Tax=Dimargaris cristalligena TaxID=215637 RepID=A0A4P9ZSP5_9FUNG|nr:hypothetical protein BJ085DRAFT_38421 [Dimargaris cristalligena]|eukprot:RKP36513.1 hypothetical protein BJ085DRAFT_38421 [Dimargaris cristalligena]
MIVSNPPPSFLNDEDSDSLGDDEWLYSPDKSFTATRNIEPVEWLRLSDHEDLGQEDMDNCSSRAPSRVGTIGDGADIGDTMSVITTATSSTTGSGESSNGRPGSVCTSGSFREPTMIQRFLQAKQRYSVDHDDRDADTRSVVSGRESIMSYFDEPGSVVALSDHQDYHLPKWKYNGPTTSVDEAIKKSNDKYADYLNSWQTHQHPYQSGLSPEKPLGSPGLSNRDSMRERLRLKPSDVARWSSGANPNGSPSILPRHPSTQSLPGALLLNRSPVSPSAPGAGLGLGVGKGKGSGDGSGTLGRSRNRTPQLAATLGARKAAPASPTISTVLTKVDKATANRATLPARLRNISGFHDGRLVSMRESDAAGSFTPSTATPGLRRQSIGGGPRPVLSRTLSAQPPPTDLNPYGSLPAFLARRPPQNRRGSLSSVLTPPLSPITLGTTTTTHSNHYSTIPSPLSPRDRSMTPGRTLYNSRSPSSTSPPPQQYQPPTPQTPLARVASSTLRPRASSLSMRSPPPVRTKKSNDSIRSTTSIRSVATTASSRQRVNHTTSNGGGSVTSGVRTRNQLGATGQGIGGGGLSTTLNQLGRRTSRAVSTTTDVATAVTTRTPVAATGRSIPRPSPTSPRSGHAY